MKVSILLSLAMLFVCDSLDLSEPSKAAFSPDLEKYLVTNNSHEICSGRYQQCLSCEIVYDSQPAHMPLRPLREKLAEK